MGSETCIINTKQQDVPVNIDTTTSTTTNTTNSTTKYQQQNGYITHHTNIDQGVNNGNVATSEMLQSSAKTTHKSASSSSVVSEINKRMNINGSTCLTQTNQKCVSHSSADNVESQHNVVSDSVASTTTTTTTDDNGRSTDDDVDIDALTNKLSSLVLSPDIGYVDPAIKPVFNESRDQQGSGGQDEWTSVCSDTHTISTDLSSDETDNHNRLLQQKEQSLRQTHTNEMLHKPLPQPSSTQCNCAVNSSPNVSYVQYESELQMPDIMRLIQKDLSEPYSIYTYRYFIHNWPRLCFLATCGQMYIGAIVCKLDYHKKMVRRGYIAMLAVDENHRRLRIGSALVRLAIKEMIKGSCDEVVLETEVTNKPALRLYENLGFVRDKRLFRYYLNGVDALRLKLWLR